MTNTGKTSELINHLTHLSISKV